MKIEKPNTIKSVVRWFKSMFTRVDPETKEQILLRSKVLVEQAPAVMDYYRRKLEVATGQPVDLDWLYPTLAVPVNKGNGREKGEKGDGDNANAR